MQAKSLEEERNKHGNKTGLRRWLWMIPALVAVVSLVLVVLGLTQKATVANVDGGSNAFTVRKDNLAVTVTESGSIKARNSIDIKSEVEGQTTIISIVPEGTYITREDVNNGKILVALDSSTPRDQLELRRIDLATAQANFTDANESYLIQVKQNESDITAAQLKVKFALMDLQRYLGEMVAKDLVEQTHQDPNANIDMAALIKQVEDPNLGTEAAQKTRELTGNNTLALENLAKATYTLKWTEELFAKKYVAQTELQKDQLEKKRYEIEKIKGEIAIRLFGRYEFPKQVEQFLSNYAEARRELERTEARARSKLAQAMALLTGMDSKYQLQKALVSKLQRQIAGCTIKAPAPGLVVYSSSGDPFRGRERRIEEGAAVYERQNIISLPDTSEMVAEISVHESSVDKVRPGQSARITVDSLPDTTFTGKVLKVAPLPDAQRGFLSPDIKVYTTQVSIEGLSESLRPGKSAKVEILVEQLQDVTIVPVLAVANREGKKLCYVVTPQGAQPRELQTGAFNNTFVQITDGLTVGEQVLLNVPNVVQPRATARAKGPTEETQQVQEEGEAELGRTASDAEDRGQKTEGRRQRTQDSSLSGSEGQEPASGGRGQRQLENLSAEQKAEMRKRLESMSPEERQKIDELKKKFESMSPEERRKQFEGMMRERSKQDSGSPTAGQ
jgi:HlyD family secretion protein